MIKLNKAEYLDKLYACWIGKNIGGTLGTPFEGTREFIEVTGFNSPEGEPLPNDDLDLQLVWLNAMEDIGPEKLTTNVLGDYWLQWITPHYNEYGIGKTNLSIGLLPPMSGEVDNDRWKKSNGAWIRSEVWAGLAPVVSDVAVKYAVMDGMVDHGIAEGTCAEIFTASMESAAYVESDIRKLLEISLSKIPADSMVAGTVRLVMDCYDKGEDYKQAREKVLEFNKELGWFQAPGNLGFVTIGLLYGEGDFKKSVLYAINCGDDTDCTGGTVASILGIIGGTKALPEDWRRYVGDGIACICINAGHFHRRIPKNCTQLTERVAALVPEVMRANGVDFAFVDGPTEVSETDFSAYNRKTSVDFLNFSPYSYDVTHYDAMTVKVELDKSPRVAPGEERQVTLTFRQNPRSHEQRKLLLKLFTPETWTHGNYERVVTLEYYQPGQRVEGVISTSFTVTAGEQMNPVNRVYVEVTSPTIPYPMMIPVIFIG